MIMDILRSSAMDVMTCAASSDDGKREVRREDGDGHNDEGNVQKTVYRADNSSRDNIGKENDDTRQAS